MLSSIEVKVSRKYLFLLPCPRSQSPSKQVSDSLTDQGTVDTAEEMEEDEEEEGLTLVA